MISTVALVPELKLGLVVLTNSINSLSSAVMYRVIDSYTGAESRDWNTFYLERYRKGAREIETWSGIEPRDGGKGWTVNPDDYIGTYGGPMYGDARVTKKDGNKANWSLIFYLRRFLSLI